MPSQNSSFHDSILLFYKNFYIRKKKFSSLVVFFVSGLLKCVVNLGHVVGWASPNFMYHLIQSAQIYLIKYF